MNSQQLHTCPVIPMDTCPDDPGADPRTNYMSLNFDECREEFTTGQNARMHAAWDLYRTGSKAPLCTKICNLMVPDYFNSVGQRRQAMCDLALHEDTCDKAKAHSTGKDLPG